MILPLMITLVISLFLNPAPAFIDGHCFSVESQRANGALGRRNLCDLSSITHHEEHDQQSGYGGGDDYDPTKSYHSSDSGSDPDSGSHYGGQEVQEDPARVDSTSGAEGGYGSSKMKPVTQHDDSQKKSNGASYDPKAQKQAGSGAKKADKYAGRKDAHGAKVSKDPGHYGASKPARSAGSTQQEDPPHFDHVGIVVPKDAKTVGDPYHSPKSEKSDGKKAGKQPSYSGGKKKTDDGTHYSKAGGDKDNDS